MTDLSPQARAVLNAYWDGVPLETGLACGLAAALRAAADQVVPEWCLEHQSNDSEWQTGFIDANCRIRADLLAIAAELEGVNDR